MSGVLTWARLSFRLQRLEIMLLTAVVLVASGLMAWFAFQLDGIAAASPTCDFLDPAVSCQAAGESFSSVFGLGELIIISTSLVTFGVGLSSDSRSSRARSSRAPLSWRGRSAARACGGSSAASPSRRSSASFSSACSP